MMMVGVCGVTYDAFQTEHYEERKRDVG